MAITGTPFIGVADEIRQTLCTLRSSVNAMLKRINKRQIHASTAMNVVLAEEAAEIAAVEPGPMFRQNPHRKLAERLRELLHAVEESGYPGDRLVTDAWAEELGLRDWYEWKRLDEVR